MDIKGAYLNGILQETIYMQQPEGCEDGTDRVCKLNKTMYVGVGNVTEPRVRATLSQIGLQNGNTAKIVVSAPFHNEINTQKITRYSFGCLVINYRVI
jgi:hypothetical protein